MPLLSLWWRCGLVILAGYALPARLIDRRLALGTW